MTIKTGDKVPAATLMQMGDKGPQSVDLAAKLTGRKVVLFGLPGAFTGTCTTAHLPSFMRTKPQFDAKGVDEIICVSVNDPFVMKAWADSTGAGEAGLTLLADPDASFTKAIGMDFDAPPAGLFGRSKRFAMLVDNGVVSVLHDGDKPGECTVASGETLLDSM
ncbi:MAG: peroxiredoxin [Roseivivax sp.]|nr:peroxiredoxin [Roseivivax sp.]